MKVGRKLRRQALSIFRAALAAADPGDAIRRHVRLRDGVLLAGRARYPLRTIRNVHVVGAGKAGAAMAQAIEKLGVPKAQRGASLVNVKYGYTAKPARPAGWIEFNECGHPVPDERGVLGAQRIAEIAAGAGPDDLVICLVSGGASALLPLPAPPVTLAEKQEVTRLLLASGADIHEINAVRKHISLIKGGQLARMAYPARVLSLILSDVIGDDLDVIGSGLTAPDASAFSGARAVLEKYSLLNRVPLSVADRLTAGMRGEIRETPKTGDRAFARTQNLVVGSNRLAVEAAAAHSRELGFRTMILSTTIEGETRDVARVHAAIAWEIAHYGRPLAPPACLISGGETTVTLRGAGLGGRNQEFVLAAAIDIAGSDSIVILSGGTDGTDGPTGAAGAIADGQTLARGPGAREYLTANDSYHYFEKLDDLLITGPTNTNVMDVHIVLVGAGM
ncbi:MAG TPA: glycerate kinase [Bryobacteraceae bacterium]|nr:glycerate kinase [Bryobacteraceae bacterium]